MKLIPFGAAAIAAVVFPALAMTSAVAQTASPPANPPPPNPQIAIAYVKPSNPALMGMYQQLQENKVLETLQRFLSPLELPKGTTLNIRFDQCGATNVRAVRGGPVTICYEYVAGVEQMAPKVPVVLAQGTILPKAAIAGPVVEEVLHQTAIGIFDALDLPVWGRTGDAADRLSAFILLQFGPQIAWNTVTGTAYFLASNSTAPPANAAPAARAIVSGDVQERYYTMLCIAYGLWKNRADAAQAAGGVNKSPFRDFLVNAPFNEFVGSDAAGDLPTSRAQACPAEYYAIAHAFGIVIRPHVDGAKLEAVLKYPAWVSFGG